MRAALNITYASPVFAHSSAAKIALIFVNRAENMKSKDGSSDRAKN
jgi:predicted fused transcriptional regulator/phosphomethylpyrimidine kinase